MWDLTVPFFIHCYYTSSLYEGRACNMRMESGLSSHLLRIHAWEAQKRGILGEGIGVAVLDTGIYPHPDFFVHGNRIAAFADFVNGQRIPYDDANHGTHISGIIASGGRDRMGQTRGIAPMAHLVCAKILDGAGNGKTSTALAAFQWISQIKEKYNIRVINISMGMTVEHPRDEFSPFMEAINELWDGGLVIVAAAGNNGPGEKTITAPGIGRKLITVGSCEDGFSGQGPTINCIKKPDLCAPGRQILSCRNEGSGYICKSGTSMSTPMVSAAAALLLSREPWLTPKEVKYRLLASAKDLHLPWQQQGAGMLDIRKLLRI